MPDSPEMYCQFGKRFLDGFSWLAPVTNNRVGDALNIEFVHEQLFFIQGDKVVEDVGYGEKGTRFSEADFGKPIESLEAMRAAGYWLVGRRFAPEVAREALAEQEDGYYYSFFSNQCQDWADRLRRRMERIEKARGLSPRKGETTEAEQFAREMAPTVPASALFAIIAIMLGVGACLAPSFAGQKSMMVLALFLVVSGLADVMYAFHGRVWSQILQTVLFAGLNLIAGLALLADTAFVARWAGGLFGIALAGNGLVRLGVGLRSRPAQNWLAGSLTGLGMLVLAILLFTRTVGERDAIFGYVIGFNLFLGGASTLWLRWTASKETAETA